MFDIGIALAPGGARCDDGREPDDPARYLWPDELDAADPTVADDDLYGPPAHHHEAVRTPLTAIPPGAVLAMECEASAASVRRLRDAELLDLVEAFERIGRWAAGMRIEMIAAYADRHPAGTTAPPPGASVAGPVVRWVPDELAMTVHVPRLEARSMIAAAQRLTHVLPGTLAALQDGRIDERRADTISYATRSLSDATAREVETAVLAKADGATHRQLYDRTRRAVHRADPDGELRRHRAARAERRVTMSPGEDGMATLWAFGPGADCEATFTMLTRLARSLGTDDPRTLDERRFDLLAQVVQGRIDVTDLADLDAVLTSARTPSTVREAATSDGREGGAGEAGMGEAGAGENGAASPAGDALVGIAAGALARQPRASDVLRKPLVQVVVGLDTLLGSDRPAELLGHGPIPAVTARALAAGGVWARLVTDPVSGALLDHGRSTYVPPAALADHVRARDQVCRGPCCTRPVHDLDHHHRWEQGGDTGDANLNGYCRSHHVLKDLDGWHVLSHPDGRLTWVSPSGRSETTHPYDYRPFTDDLRRVSEVTDGADGTRTCTQDDGGSTQARRAETSGPVGQDDDPPPF